MTVEIWSDIMCPFCYIGKRKFENALQQFDHKGDINIQWRSFQLDPAMESNSGKSLYSYLAERKGWTLDYSRKVHQQMAVSAAELGLNYQFDKAIPANSFNAHRLSHLAGKYNLGNEMEERIFAAYFTEGKNIDDLETLVQLATETGLPEQEARTVLQFDAYAEEVVTDIDKAQQLGVRGVPFFVLDNKYAVSGAQDSTVFLGALQKAWAEHDPGNFETVTVSDGAACTIDGDC